LLERRSVRLRAAGQSFALHAGGPAFAFYLKHNRFAVQRALIRRTLPASRFFFYGSQHSVRSRA
jgi:hypothetical protein